MILFADAEARVIGAAHAGWKGARDGVVEATVAAMAALGAEPRADRRRARARASRRPPTRSAPSSSKPSPPTREAPRFFVASRNAGRVDVRPARLYRRCARRAPASARFVDLGLDTYADEARFFSYRRKTHRGEADYGRLVSAIALV